MINLYLSKKHPIIALLLICLSGCNYPPGASSPAPALGATSPPSNTPITSIPTSTRGPTSVPIRPSVRIVGEEEIVFDWTTDRCADDMLPDLPVRAFRDAQGSIQLNLSFTRNFRLIGPNFDSLKPDCQVTLASDVDPDPSHYNFKEWMGSTYTLDGQTVYALIHNEWYGKEGARWDPVRDFSDEQGFREWYYQGWAASQYTDMRYDAANNRWQGGRPLCQIGRTWVHPDLGCEVARTWVSPIDATVTISGAVSDADPGGGNGVVVTILKADEELWSATIENGDTQGKTFSLEVSVQTGDQIHFRVNARGDSGWDSTVLNPTINIGPLPCPSGVHNDCLMMSITYAISTDGGRTFTQPQAPDHLVAVLPYQWMPDAGHLAIWQPSNIIKNPQDDYFYALVQIDNNPRGQSGFQGMCLMRTQTLDDPKSWRAWDGTGFSLPFIDPYRENVTSPAQQTCEAVSQPTVGGLSYSLTYSSFFDRFIVVGHDIFKDPPGFYYSLSEDLIHWSSKRLLMAADLAQIVNFQAPYLAYPSLIDPDSPSLSFDVIGQSPYLYFTRINGMNPLDFDLVRVRIEFNK